MTRPAPAAPEEPGGRARARLAAGCSHYHRDGAASGISEPGSLCFEGGHLVLRGRRLLHGRCLLEVTADFRGPLCTRMLVTLGEPAGVPPFLGFEAEGRLVCRRGDDALRSLALPRGCLLFPLLRAATGALLAQLERAPRWIVVPALQTPQAAQLLRPRLSRRHVKPLDDTADGARRLRYFGGEYGRAGAEHRLDADGLLAAYRWPSPQGLWEVRLERDGPVGDRPLFGEVEV